jgi:hypothetical protein
LATEPPVDDRADSSPESAIAPISIVEEMKTSYLDYAMSVIVNRIEFSQCRRLPRHRRSLRLAAAIYPCGSVAKADADRGLNAH